MPTSREIEQLERRLDKLEKEVKKLEDFKLKVALARTLSDLLTDCKYVNQYAQHLLKKAESEEDLKRLDCIVRRITSLMEDASKLLIACEVEKAEAHTKLSSEKALPEIVKCFVSSMPKFWLTYGSLAPYIGYATMAYTFFAITFAVLTLRPPPLLYFPPGPTIADLSALVLGFALALVIHEFFHAAVALAHKVEVKAIGFMAGEFTGGFVHVDQKAYEKGSRFLAAFSAAGIGGNMVFGASFYLVGSLLALSSLLWLGTANVLLALINALPLRSSDGGWLYADLLENMRNEKFRRLSENLPRFVALLWVALLLLAISA